MMGTKSLMCWMLLLFTSPFIRADSLTFTLIPTNGEVAGLPGSTVAWGYSITSDSATAWLVPTDVNSDPFLEGTPNLIFDFPIVPPGGTVTVPFSPFWRNTCSSPPCGLFELTWDPNAPTGFTNTGTFTVSFEWWTGDPLQGGTFLMNAPDAQVPYSAAVIPSPEPSTVLLVIAGLLALGFAQGSARSSRLITARRPGSRVPGTRVS